MIAGEGHLRATLEGQARSAGLQHRILFAGRVGNLGDWYENADLYAMTSEFEGFPNTLAEAMAHGLPAVSFDCETGPRDIIRHGIDGFLIRPNDTSGLKAAMDRLMGDTELRTQFATNAIEVRTRFSLEKTSLLWEHLFKECARAKSGAIGLTSTNPKIIQGVVNESRVK